MRILKLSTNTGGGATIAAERQAVAMRKDGHTVKHLFVRQNWDSVELSLEERGDNVYVSSAMPSYLKTDFLFQSFLKNNRTDISNTYMSLWRRQAPFDDLIIEYIEKNAFDAVHLHWVSSLASSRLIYLLGNLNIPVVITGHDMNHFAGACHYDAGCSDHVLANAKSAHVIHDPHFLIQASLEEKYRAITTLRPQYIFPSKWLYNEYGKSDIGQALGEESGKVIRNCIDTDYFSPLPENDRRKLRAKLGFSDNEIVVVSGAENNNEIRKGFEYFEHSVREVNRRSFGRINSAKISFVAFGGGDHVVSCSHPDVNYKHMGVLDESSVRDLFQAADLLAFTSIEENFANVILEALMCGCPIIGFNIGGIPDIVQQGQNGCLVNRVSLDDFSDKIASLLFEGEAIQLRNNTRTWRERESKMYSYKSIADQLIGVYESLRHGRDKNVAVV